MADIKNRKVTKSEVSQKINLRDALGGVAGVPEIREAFLQTVIDRIVERTQSGRDVENKIFSEKYSTAYKNSLPFKVYGKTNKVNMTLTGDMIQSIDKIDESRDTATIGITGDENILKAFAHITGFEGHPHLDGQVKPRDFFGISQKEIDKITDKFKPDTDKGRTANDAKLIEKILNVLDEAE
jgi:hypothetical protein